MIRLRLLFLTCSISCLLLFSALLAVAVGSDSREDLFRSLGILTEVVHLVETEYVDELNDEALALSLDAGLLESVDRWAAAVPAEHVEAYEQLLLSPPPFGLVVGGRLGSAAVRQALPGSPADTSGLKSWEVIEQVEGINTRGRPLWQIRLKLRDLETSKIAATLAVVDRNMEERREVVLQPTEWAPEAIEVTDHENARVIKVVGLGPSVVDEMRDAVHEASRVILDLRKLVWGAEAEAIAVADLFREDGELGRWSGRRAGERIFDADKEKIHGFMPIVLLGPETEGVGEILAGALARGGATLVGWPTMGHAPHMRFVHAGDLHLWIPVGQWLRADGDPINGNGIEPVEEVDDFDDEDGEDHVLARALELIAEEAAEAEPAELDKAA